MKPLTEVLMMEGDHVVMDCCPVRQSEDQDSCPVNDLDLRGGDKNEPRHAFPEEITRQGHIFYLNIGIAHIMTKEKGFIDVTCPVCKSIYKLTNDYLTQEADRLFKEGYWTT